MEDLDEMSPIRVLQRNLRGGLQPGELGVITARAGVGKTACLVQFGLDNLLRNKKVLHLQVAGENLDGVKLWYDTILDDTARATGVEDGGALRQKFENNRIIHLHNGDHFSAEHFCDTLDLYARNLGFEPDLILVDGFPWTGQLATTAATLGALKIVTRSHGAHLWMTAQSHRDMTPTHESGTPAPADRYFDVVDAVIQLMPRRDGLVALNLLKHGDDDIDTVRPLVLHPHTMRLIGEGDTGIDRLPPSLCTLLSGGATGAEATFGACAERYGLTEVNFTFEGKPLSRRRGVRRLTGTELQRGARRAKAIREQSTRKLPKTPLLDKVLLSIWHQVETAGQVFVVGMIQDDDAVKGGTGWAADIARAQNKPVFVFDQERRAWFAADDQGTGWTECPIPPRITSSRFTGTGSRHLSDDGRDAIRDLFERSFGAR